MSSPSTLKPIKTYGKAGPNPSKVIIILEGLNLPYEIEDVPFPDVKKPAYVAVNPNGRLPAIHDPNTGLTLWESGAIVEYLIERYDTDRKLSFAPGSNGAYHAKQWLFFQTTGQGPYYGQAFWFKMFHGEKLQSAIDRYVNEVKRVTAVIEGQLAREKELHSGEAGFDGPWLVGNKLSYADISFIPWQTTIAKTLGESGEYDAADFPLVTEWLAKLTAKESVKKALGL